MGHSRPLFLYFRLFNFNVQLVDKVCRCWDSNRGSLVSEATALPTEPPPLPLPEPEFAPALNFCLASHSPCVCVCARVSGCVCGCRIAGCIFLGFQTCTGVFFLGAYNLCLPCNFVVNFAHWKFVLHWAPRHKVKFFDEVLSFLWIN